MHEIRLRPIGDAPHVSAIQLAPGESKTIGRSLHADIVVDEPSLSRRHARITIDDGGALVVEDLASTNGVFVNGRQAGAAALHVGDTLRLGFVEYSVEDAGSADAAREEKTILRMPASVPALSPAAIDAAALEGLLAISRDLMAFTDLAGCSITYSIGSSRSCSPIGRRFFCSMFRPGNSPRGRSVRRKRTGRFRTSRVLRQSVKRFGREKCCRPTMPRPTRV